MTTSEDSHRSLGHIATLLLVSAMEEKTDVTTSRTVGTERITCVGTLQHTGADGTSWAEGHGNQITLHVSDDRGAGLEETFPLNDVDDAVLVDFVTRAHVSITLGLAVTGGDITTRTDIKVNPEKIRTHGAHTR